jgi:hypothetical protein
MLAAYRYLAYTLPALVVVQLAAVAWGTFGIVKYNDTHAIPKGGLGEDSTLSFSGDAGFAIHGIVGMMVIPLVAVLLLVVSFLVKFKGSWQIALGLLIAVVLQVVLGIVSFDAPVVGILHAVNAVGIMGMGAAAAKRATDAQPAAA